MESSPITNHLVAIIKLDHLDPSAEYIQRKAEKLIKRLKLTVVNKICHQFPVQGITLAYILSQSHLVIHTWPEYNLIHMDLATCVSLNMEDMESVIGKVFGVSVGKQIEMKEIQYR